MKFQEMIIILQPWAGSTEQSYIKLSSMDLKLGLLPLLVWIVLRDCKLYLLEAARGMTHHRRRDNTWIYPGTPNIDNKQ
jgi:hypothetical protein